MTVVVGHPPGGGGRDALALGAQLARATASPLHVVTVVPRPWSTPSLARVDAEWAEWTRAAAADAADSARAVLTFFGVPLDDVEISTAEGRSASSALAAAAERVGAEHLVLGSSTDGQLGQVVVGSTAGRLLHSSPVPLALSPRGYRTAPGSGLTRVTCAVGGSDAASAALAEHAGALAVRAGAGLRLVSLGVRGEAMHPPEVGLRAEEQVLAAWAEQSRASLDALLATGGLPTGTTSEVATGEGWGDALDALDWSAGEVLVVGSSEGGVLARVFLGSRATKLVRHSPVPVLVRAR